jgi:hypothetical protein
LVRRSTHLEDQRLAVISITDEGRRLLECERRSRAAWHFRGLQVPSPDERALRGCSMSVGRRGGRRGRPRAPGVVVAGAGDASVADRPDDRPRRRARWLGVDEHPYRSGRFLLWRALWLAALRTMDDHAARHRERPGTRRGRPPRLHRRRNRAARAQPSRAGRGGDGRDRSVGAFRKARRSSCRPRPSPSTVSSGEARYRQAPPRPAARGPRQQGSAATVVSIGPGPTGGCCLRAGNTLNPAPWLA